MLSPGAASAENAEYLSREVQRGLALIGLLALIDPPCSEIPEVIHTLHGAGIRGCMVRSSLLAYGLFVGTLPSERSPRTVKVFGTFREVADDFGLRALAIARQCDILTKRIVNGSLSLKLLPLEIVALSSTPRAADISISLTSGSDVYLEAASMVLLDCSTAIVEAIKYGWLLFDNLKKIMVYLFLSGS
ncbi:K P-type ATPase (mediates high-affinity potassium or sodium uptake) [Apiospora marii]|uniref:K P-type ATPase (Mediates high-affinity potassium or sodium uptake) n=1 Tax=Apiospora marii TaxID=335849 RepID=A0ABR1R670_9PEZI